MTLTTPAPPAPPPPAAGRRARPVAPAALAEPRWARPGLAALLLGTALLYLWSLGASGYANEFYAAAVQAGTQSWKAMFFGSLDAGNAITVDKPAFFLWPMEISARIFGLNGWSMLVPQALEGVAAVALLAAGVRRVAGHAAGLAAGALLAITPVAVLMFRFDNPDAMLTLLLTASAYATVRALQSVSRGQWWLALAGTLVGLGFITKMGQALLVVPALVIAYLWAAPLGLGRRVRDLLGAGVALVAGAGWWIAIVQLWPASDRPYIGGSSTNSVLELAFGYNGLGRLFGGTGNGGGAGGGGGASFAGSPGLSRLFTSSSGMATEISWLLPTALLALVAALWLTRRRPRTDLTRAALVLFGGWLLVTGLVFSYMQGTIHPYYAVALAPAIAAIVAITGALLWADRRTTVARVAAAVLLEVTVLWDAHLLGLTPTFLPWLPAVLVLGGTLGAVALLVGGRWRRFVAAGLLVGVLAGAGGSAAYAVDTASRVHTGSTPSSGPAHVGAGGFGGRTGGAPASSGTDSSGTSTSGATGTPAGSDEAASDSALVALLASTTSRWAAATIGSQSAAPLQLAGGNAVMAIGGFNGSDDAPALAQFQEWVQEGLVRYFIAGNGMGGGMGGGSSTGSTSASEITSWVESAYTSTTVGGVTVYDLTSAGS
jgi:4-amino-4-deoxy-L-arabinose transferase-like glycosyltransferase